MKALLICIFLAVSFFVAIKDKHNNMPATQVAKPSSTTSILPDTSIINFSTDVKPIFVNHCSPCHFTGGKMYERLPFDQDTTIIMHEEAILRRIKDVQEKKLIKQYIQQQDK